MDGDDGVPSNLEDELLSFRQQWHNELAKEDSLDQNKSSNNDLTSTTENSSSKQDPLEEKAAKLFLDGVRCEREGHLDAAVYYYRKAVHLVPDIEFKLAEYQVQSKDDASDLLDEEDELDQSPTTSSCAVSVIANQLNNLKLSGLCVPLHPQEGMHVSLLPTELLILVFRWVVSNDLDVRSLETLSAVCKWFYACAKDEELWKAICIRVWGVNISSNNQYNGWRNMIILRPRVKYDGLYISFNTYVRIGEQTIGCYYKPCHLVEYYKYLRFFADGTVLIYTAGEEPQSVIQLLQQPPQRYPDGCYRGYYRLTNTNIVNIFFTRISQLPLADNYRRRRREKPPDVKEQNFIMKLELEDSSKRRNNVLLWNNYTYHVKNRRTGEPIGVENDISYNDFKPFVFSRIKRYNSKSSAIL